MQEEKETVFEESFGGVFVPDSISEPFALNQGVNDDQS